MRRAIGRFRYGDIEVGLDRHGPNRSTVWARSGGDEHIHDDYHVRDYGPPHYPDGPFPVARSRFIDEVVRVMEDVDQGLLGPEGGAS